MGQRAYTGLSFPAVFKRTRQNNLKIDSTVRKLGRQTYLSSSKENDYVNVFPSVWMHVITKILRRTVFGYYSISSFFELSKGPVDMKRLRFSSKDILKLPTEMIKV